MPKPRPFIFRYLRTAFTVLILVGCAFFGYQYREQIVRVFNQQTRKLIAPLLPCGKPLTYSIGTFDKQFGISQKDFLAATASAEQIWERPAGRVLFAYATSGGDVTVNLMYDTRQEMTQQLQKLGITVHNDRATYDALKTKYDSLDAAYKKQAADLDTLVAQHNALVTAWQREVADWNAKGGAPEADYQRLTQEKNAINVESDLIREQQNKLNALVEQVNALAAELNRLIPVLNLAVDKYNSVGASQSGEFEEGLYSYDKGTATINIYQYDSKAKLVRVLAHEFGHALGLEHIDDPKAIMYRLNNGTAGTPTAADVKELKRVCDLL